MPNWVWIVIIILLVFWLLGLVTHFLGGLIYILLVIAIILLIIWLVQRIRTKRYTTGFKGSVLKTAQRR
jgi:hypothetical protein